MSESIIDQDEIIIRRTSNGFSWRRKCRRP